MRYNEALAERGDNVEVISLRREGQPKITASAGVQITGLQTRKVNERSPFTYLARILLFSLRAMLVVSWRHLRSPYDVVHIHSVPDFLVFTAWLPKLMGARLILDIHDLLPELYASKFHKSEDSFVFKLLLLVEKISIAFADHVITANDIWQEKLVRRAVAPEKATTLLNYPRRSVFYRRGRMKPESKFTMIYPGTLNWHQGLDIAIEAFGEIKDEVPDAEFHIYGVGPALPDLTQLVAKLGLQERVRFKGTLPSREIVQVMENSDLGIVPKRKNSFGNEAFSTKTLEFMALGVPVIVSDTKVDAYYFNDSLVKFFRGGDPDDLARCMRELIKDRSARERLAANGLEFARNNSWEAKQSRYFELLDCLLPCEDRSSPGKTGESSDSLHRRLHWINPLTDDRWARFVRDHPQASVFHSQEWLRALKLTYGYEPLAATTCAPDTDLTNAVVFCRVDSFLTGKRLVSLPFSDHCEPLVESETELNEIISLLPQMLKSLRVSRCEIRPLRALPQPDSAFCPSAGYFFHQIDLTRGSAEIFRSFHRDSIQRKIRRAESEHLTYEEGRSEKLIADFYRLLLLTRRRHRLPPQPLAWFRNLAACLQERMKVRVAYKDGRAIAAIVTLHSARSLVYKYGCSDEDSHRLGGMQMLFWRTIQEAIESRQKTFDLGRCEINNEGLATFKERLGARRSLLSYWCMPPSKVNSRTWSHSLLGRTIAVLPDPLLAASGRLLYKHVG